MVTAKHDSASLRVMDVKGKGLRTFSNVNRALDRTSVAKLLQGVNEIMATPATNAMLTVRDELSKQP